MKKDFKKILKNHGHYILYGYAQHDQSCTCKRDDGEADNDCPLCFGTGLYYRWYKMKTRRYENSSTGSSVQGEKQGASDLLSISSVSFQYYLLPELNYAENDLIIEYQQEYLHGNTLSPDVFLVKNALPREGEGEIVYYHALADKKFANKKQVQGFIDRLSFGEVEVIE
mgnify:CR=1 FL=1